MKIYNDVKYANDDLAQTLDIYSPHKTDINLPVLVHIHGGAWTYGDKSNKLNYAKFYCQKGFIVVSISYRLSEKDKIYTKHPTHAQDCACAVAWVYKNIKNYQGNKDCIYLSGHSSGAHLASLITTDSQYLMAHNIYPKKIKGIIAVDTAAFNLNSYSYIDDSANEQMQLMKKRVKEIFSHKTEILLNASPISHIGRETSDRFLVIVSQNRPLAKRVSKNFVKKLQNHGKEALLIQTNIFDHNEINAAMSQDNNEVSKSILEFIKYD